MSATVAVISNPASGRNRKHLAEVAAAAQAEGFTHHTPSHAELSALVQRLAGEGTDLLVVNGGDGTLVDVVTALRSAALAREPMLAVLRGGTTNLVHADVGLSGCRLKALSRLGIAIRRGDLSRHREARPPLVLTTGSNTRYGFFLGLAGLPHAILHARERWHRRGMCGPLSEAFVLLTMLWRLLTGRAANDTVLAPCALGWRSDGLERQVDCIFGYVTSLERLMLGLRPVAPNGGLALLLLTHPYRRFWWLLPNLFAGLTLPKIPGLVTLSASEFTLSPATTYVLDGDLIEPFGAPLHLRAGPPLSFVVV